MDQSPTKTPAAPKARLANLPDIDDGEDFPSVVDENTDIKDLPPSQLYDLNLTLFNESVPDRPLIDEIVPISELRAEYEHGSPSFVQQIDWLEGKGYHSIRRTKGDGDCFYRSTAFAFIERLINVPSPDVAVLHTLEILESTLVMLKIVGFQSLVYEDFYEAFAALIRNVVEPDEDGMTLTPIRLVSEFQIPERSNAIVYFLRLVTSAQIRVEPDFAAVLFHPETGEYMEARLFCEHFVEAGGKEADHVQMTALCRALKLNIDVAYLDGRRSDSVDFVPIRSVDEDDPIVLLYRPGHYDILVGPVHHTN